MFHLCAAKVLVPLLLAWQLTGVPDALHYVEAARMYDVPPALVFATKWQETRYSMRNTEVSVAGAHGAMQIMPRYWGWQCGTVYGARYRERNIHCGALVLKFYLERCNGDTYCAAFHYVGGDSSYAKEVGFRTLVLGLKAKVLWPVAQETPPSSP